MVRTRSQTKIQKNLNIENAAQLPKTRKSIRKGGGPKKVINKLPVPVLGKTPLVVARKIRRSKSDRRLTPKNSGPVKLRQPFSAKIDSDEEIQFQKVENSPLPRLTVKWGFKDEDKHNICPLNLSVNADDTRLPTLKVIRRSSGFSFINGLITTEVPNSENSDLSDSDLDIVAWNN